MKPGEVLLDTYRIERVLGRGGMGEVASALHLRLGERVAIKILREERGDDQQPKLRLSREAQAAAKLRGEHSIRVFDLRELPGGAPIIVMEFVEGGSLADLLQERGPLPLGEAIDYTLQAAEGLAEAHAQGIVHRDIKPANLLLTRRPDGTPLLKVSDFGLATADRLERITGSNVTLGSPPYMSPEQIRTPHAVDARSDVWSLAIVLYELCTGALPWSGYTSAGILASIAADQPISARSRRSELPPELDEALLQALEKQPSTRIASVADLAHLLAPMVPGGAEKAKRIERILQAPPRELPADSPPLPAPETEETGEATQNRPTGAETPLVSTEASVLALTSSGLPDAALRAVPPAPRNPAWRWGALGAAALLPAFFVLRGATTSPPQPGALSAAASSLHRAPPSEGAAASLAQATPPAPSTSSSMQQTLATVPTPSATVPIPLATATTTSPTTAIKAPPAKPQASGPPTAPAAPPPTATAPAPTAPTAAPPTAPVSPRGVDPLDQLGPRK